MSRRSNRNNRRRRNGGRVKYSPQLCLVQALDVDTANVPGNQEIYGPTTNSFQSVAGRVSFQVRSAKFVANAGATASQVFIVLRRVPEGYAAPTSITPADGIGSFIDEADILGYAYIFFEPTDTTTFMVPLKMMRSTMTMYPGDTIVIQGVSTTSSASLVVNGIVDYGVAYLQ